MSRKCLAPVHYLFSFPQSFWLIFNKFHHSASQFLVSVWFVALGFIVWIANIKRACFVLWFCIIPCSEAPYNGLYLKQVLVQSCTIFFLPTFIYSVYFSVISFGRVVLMISKIASCITLNNYSVHELTFVKRVLLWCKAYFILRVASCFYPWIIAFKYSHWLLQYTIELYTFT